METPTGHDIAGSSLLGSFDLIGGDGVSMIETAWPVREDAVNEANLRLIAAAPDLLATLRMVFAWALGSSTVALPLHEIDAVLAKATTEAQS